MKKLLVMVIVGLFVVAASYADEAPACAKMPFLLKKACLRLHQIWVDGDNDVYLTLYAWHNRYTYTPEKMATTIYNERAWGGGFGRSLYDEEGDWQGIYGFAFLDSHNHVQPIVGYGFQKIARVGMDLRLGAGGSVLVTMRPDIFGGYPFPGAAPMVSITFKHFSVNAAYVPGGTNIGNVLFVFTKWQFDRA